LENLPDLLTDSRISRKQIGKVPGVLVDIIEAEFRRAFPVDNLKNAVGKGLFPGPVTHGRALQRRSKIAKYHKTL
jgi:hypothetical protein